MSLHADDTGVVYKYNVRPLPLNPDDFDEDNFKFVLNAEAVQADYDWKENDIVLTTFPRSGTHMTWHLVRYLLQGNTETLRDRISESFYPPYCQMDSPQTGPRRVITSHFLPCQFTSKSILKTGNRKFLYIIRNPNDVAVSAYNLWKGFKGIYCLPSTFPEYYTQFLADTVKTIPHVGWFTHVKAWEEYAAKNPDLSIMFYMFEDLVRKPRESLRRIAEFLNIPVSEELLDDVVEAGKFRNMSTKYPAASSDFFNKNTHAGTTHFRKGVIGNWKNWLTVQNYELFQEVFPKLSDDMACKDKLIFT